MRGWAALLLLLPASRRQRCGVAGINVVWQELMCCARVGSGAELVVRLASWSRAPGAAGAVVPATTLRWDPLLKLQRGQDQAFVGQPRSSSVNLHHFHALQLRCLPLLPSLTPLVLLGEQVVLESSAGVLACLKPPDFWAAQHSEMAHRAVTKVTALVPRSYGGWQDDKL